MKVLWDNSCCCGILGAQGSVFCQPNPFHNQNSSLITALINKAGGEAAQTALNDVCFAKETPSLPQERRKKKEILYLDCGAGAFREGPRGRKHKLDSGSGFKPCEKKKKRKEGGF